jgi:hypothetical protein
MHGIITFFKTIEVKLQKSTQLLTVVDQEGNFSDGARSGTFTKYFYELVTSNPSPPTQTQFPQFIQEYLEIKSSEITNKTLRSKFFISHNFTADTTLAGAFKQTNYRNATKIFETIQGFTLGGNFSRTYKIYRDHRLFERGDCSNLEFLSTDPLQGVRVRAETSTRDTELNFVVRRNFVEEGSQFVNNASTRFSSMILRGGPRYRRLDIGLPGETTVYYSVGNRISFYGKGDGYFLGKNSEMWVLVDGTGLTFDKFGNCIYTGRFIKGENNEVILKDGLYKNFNGRCLSKSVRYWDGKSIGLAKLYGANGKVVRI